MRLILEQFEFVKDVAKLIQKAEELGYVLTAGEMWRTPVQAWINSLPANSTLTANGVEYPDKVGGVGISKSKHLDRLAVDFNIFKVDNYSRLCTVEETKPLGEYWQSLNPKNRAGCFFTTRPDAPHFERNL